MRRQEQTQVKAARQQRVYVYRFHGIVDMIRDLEIVRRDP